MGYKRKYTVFEILNIIYFLSILFAIGCKFGLFFDIRLREKIFNIFYYKVSPIVFIVSIVVIIVLLIRSKKIKNNDESTDCSKDIASVINMAVISFDFVASLFGTLTVKQIAYEWLELTIYLNMIVVIIDSLVYAFVRGRILNDFSYYNQRDMINKYIVYVIVVSFVFGIIVPNLMLHVGIVEGMKPY